MSLEAGQAGAKISFSEAPTEVVSAVEWIVENFVGEVSQATLVKALVEGALNALPYVVLQELHRYSKTPLSDNAIQMPCGEYRPRTTG